MNRIALILLSGLTALFLLVSLSDVVHFTQKKVVSVEDLAVAVSEVAKADDVLRDREIIEHQISDQNIVSYSYLGEEVPEKITPDEDVSLRTESSFTRILGTEGEGEDRVQRREARTFPQKVFYKKEDGTWLYVEHATTSLKVWGNKVSAASHWLSHLFARIAHAQNFYSQSGDGYVVAEQLANGVPDEGTCLASAWSGAIGSVAGSGFDYTTTQISAHVYMYASYIDLDPPHYDCIADIGRAFIPFPTSFLPARSNITNVSLNLLVFATHLADNDANAYISVFETSQGTHTEVTNADYLDFGSELIDSGSRVAISSLTAGFPVSIPLNATGRSAVKRSGEASSCSATAGITCLGLREGHDVATDQPLPTQTGAVFSSSESVGLSGDPYLSITYTVPDTLSIKGTSIQVRGGGIILK